MSKASFLCAVTGDPEPVGIFPLAHRGIHPGEQLADDDSAHPLNAMGPEEVPASPGFYVWEGERVESEVWEGESRVHWQGTFRPAVAGDFERFGFPMPGAGALNALRRVEKLAVEGARALPRAQLAARGALDEIRGEAARALACELAPTEDAPR
jgi:hypothetical protein